MSSIMIASNMRLFDFPAELVSKILLHAVLARGIRRALRLRLVCKRFSKEIQHAIFESRLLDDVNTVNPRWNRQEILSDWYIDNDHGASKFWHSYLVYRVQNETSKPPQRRYLDIRLVAQRVCKETGADVGTTIETLCWPALQQGISPASNSRLEKELPNPDLDLLCAAAYLNLIAMAKRLLQEGYSPHSNSLLFSSPMMLAAWAGNAQMLEIFQEHVPEVEGVFIRDWRGKVGPASIYGAAMRGDIDILHLSLYPPSRATPDSTDFVGQTFGSVDRASYPGHALRLAQGYKTSNVEVYKYLGSFFREPNNVTSNLGFHAHLGNLEMVRHLLDTGADVRGAYGRNGSPLIAACRRCHEDVVDLLLERGADPNFYGDKDRCNHGYPMAAAAASGSLAIVRKLLSHGADLRHEDIAEISMGFYALNAAVQVEHTDMVKFLVAEGAGSGGVYGGLYGENLLRSALLQGLDSMVEILRGEGITLSCEKSAVGENPRECEE